MNEVDAVDAGDSVAGPTIVSVVVMRPEFLLRVTVMVVVATVLVDVKVVVFETAAKA